VLAGLAYPYVTVGDDALGAALGPELEAVGYEHETVATMVHSGAPVPPPTHEVREVSLEMLRPAIIRDWRILLPDASEEQLAQLAELAPRPDRFDETLSGMLSDTEDVVLAQTTIVHGDFHHCNFLVDRDGGVSGVFDWDIAGPGEWRFDLVNLAFAYQIHPEICEPDALAMVIAAVCEHCDAPTAAFLTACQTLRALSMLRHRRPAWVEPASRRMQATLVEWWR
jgi:Ser/Thr protein kinase RdoA (MazF antagonist)